MRSKVGGRDLGRDPKSKILDPRPRYLVHFLDPGVGGDCER